MDDLAGVGNGANQLYTLCGRGVRSTLRILRHGLAVEETANTPMPGNPYSVWAVPTSREGVYVLYCCVTLLQC